MITNPVAPALANAAGLGTLIGNLIAMAMIIASILVLLYLVLGGLEWITSQGDKAGLEAARNRITNALIGLGIVVSAWAIMTIISSFLGLSFPKIPIPELGADTTSVYHSECSDSRLCVKVRGRGIDQCRLGSKCPF